MMMNSIQRATLLLLLLLLLYGQKNGGDSNLPLLFRMENETSRTRIQGNQKVQHNQTKKKKKKKAVRDRKRLSDEKRKVRAIRYGHPDSARALVLSSRSIERPANSTERFSFILFFSWFFFPSFFFLLLYGSSANNRFRPIYINCCVCVQTHLNVYTYIDTGAAEKREDGGGGGGAISER